MMFSSLAGGTDKSRHRDRLPLVWRKSSYILPGEPPKDQTVPWKLSCAPEQKPRDVGSRRGCRYLISTRGPTVKRMGSAQREPPVWFCVLLVWRFLFILFLCGGALPVCVPRGCSASRGQTRVADPLEPELHIVVSCHVDAED